MGHIPGRTVLAKASCHRTNRGLGRLSIASKSLKAEQSKNTAFQQLLVLLISLNSPFIDVSAWHHGHEKKNDF